MRFIVCWTKRELVPPTHIQAGYWNHTDEYNAFDTLEGALVAYIKAVQKDYYSVTISAVIKSTDYDSVLPIDVAEQLDKALDISQILKLQ